MGLLTGPPFWGSGNIPGMGIEFNGSNEDMGAGVGGGRLLDTVSPNQFVIELIFQRRNTAGALQRFLDIFDTNGVQLGVDTATTAGAAPTNPGDLRILTVTQPVGTIRKNGVLPNALIEDTWHHLIIAFNSGASLVIYLDGVDTLWPLGAWSVASDSATGAMADEDMGIKFGNTNTDSSFANMALLLACIWFQGGLSAAEAGALFNNPLRDRRVTFGAYTSSMRDRLAHFWAPSKWDGVTASTLGTDYGLVGVPRNIMGLATNIDGGDLIIPYP